MTEYEVISPNGKIHKVNIVDFIATTLDTDIFNYHQIDRDELAQLKKEGRMSNCIFGCNFEMISNFYKNPYETLNKFKTGYTDYIKKHRNNAG